MIRIAITQAAFEAIARTLALGSVSYENAVNENGERLLAGASYARPAELLLPGSRELQELHFAAGRERGGARGMIPGHYTTFLEMLDHWQSLAAGLAAILAALIAVFGAEFFAWLRARREDKAVRASLAVEMRSLLNILIDTHHILTSMKFPTGQSVVAAAEPPRPTVYLATADRMGRLRRLAADVTAFYSSLEWVRVRVNILGSAFRGDSPPSEEVNRLAQVFEHACRRCLPLLSKLPPDPDDAAIRAKVESMGKR